MMKALFDKRGFSKRAHLFKWVLYSFWAQVSSEPFGICVREQTQRHSKCLENFLVVKQTKEMWTIFCDLLSNSICLDFQYCHKQGSQQLATCLFFRYSGLMQSLMLLCNTYDVHHTFSVTQLRVRIPEICYLTAVFWWVRTHPPTTRGCDMWRPQAELPLNKITHTLPCMWLVIPWDKRQKVKHQARGDLQKFNRTKDCYATLRKGKVDTVITKADQRPRNSCRYTHRQERGEKKQHD